MKEEGCSGERVPQFAIAALFAFAPFFSAHSLFWTTTRTSNARSLNDSRETRRRKRARAAK